MFEFIDTAVTGDQFLLALHDTLVMIAVSLGFGSLLGIPLGIVLVVCRPGGILPNRFVHQVLNPIINVVRSLPFIILLITILPFTRLVVGTTIGTAGAIVPLIVFIAPYISRLVESSLLEVEYRKKLSKLIEEMSTSVNYWLAAEYRRNESEIVGDASPAKSMSKKLLDVMATWRETFDKKAESIALWFVRRSNVYATTSVSNKLKAQGDRKSVV